MFVIHSCENVKVTKKKLGTDITNPNSYTNNSKTGKKDYCCTNSFLVQMLLINKANNI